MNPLQVYQQQHAYGWTRIDMLLALYGDAVDRMQRAVEALQRDDAVVATALIDRARLLVGELIAGLDLGYGEIPRNMARLYEYVLHQLGRSTAESVAEALRILRILHEGLLAIRNEALDLERRGVIPPPAAVHAIEATV